MKSSQELLDDLAGELQDLRVQAQSSDPGFSANDWNRAQQLVGQIRKRLHDEWIKDNIL